MTNFNGGSGFGGGSLPPSTVYGDLTVTGKIFASDGALDAPSYSFTDDKKSGLFLNQGTGHGFQLSGGSTGGQVQVLKDSKAVNITGTVVTDSPATVGGPLTVTGSIAATSIISSGTIGATSITASGTVGATSITTTGSSQVDSIVTPTQPVWKRSATTQTTIKGSPQYYNLDTFVEQRGTGVFNFTVGTSLVSVLQAGYFSTDVLISFAANDPGYRALMLFYNGVIVAEQQVTCSSGEIIILSVHYEDYLSVGQPIYAQVYSNINPSLSIDISGTMTVKKTG